MRSRRRYSRYLALQIVRGVDSANKHDVMVSQLRIINAISSEVAFTDL